MKTPLETLRHHVTGKIESGDAAPSIGIPTTIRFVVMDSSPSSRSPYVAARPGFYRSADGDQVRDTSCPLTSGPEMTDDSRHAFRFATHRAAARVASRLVSARIVTV